MICTSGACKLNPMFKKYLFVKFLCTHNYGDDKTVLKVCTNSINGVWVARQIFAFIQL